MTNREKAEELVHEWHSADIVGGISLSRTAREALIVSIHGALDRAVADALARAAVVCGDDNSSTGRHLSERIASLAPRGEIEELRLAAACGAQYLADALESIETADAELRGPCEPATHTRVLRQISSAIHSLIAHARDTDAKLEELP